MREHPAELPNIDPAQREVRQFVNPEPADRPRSPTHPGDGRRRSPRTGRTACRSRTAASAGAPGCPDPSTRRVSRRAPSSPVSSRISRSTARDGVSSGSAQPPGSDQRPSDRSRISRIRSCSSTSAPRTSTFGVAYPWSRPSSSAQWAAPVRPSPHPVVRRPTHLLCGSDRGRTRWWCTPAHSATARSGQWRGGEPVRRVHGLAASVIPPAARPTLRSAPAHRVPPAARSSGRAAR